jgi:hypothetical protein
VNGYHQYGYEVRERRQRRERDGEVERLFRQLRAERQGRRPVFNAVLRRLLVPRRRVTARRA